MHREINTTLHRVYHHRTSGFTIVETLVAITVLMIAIAGPLVVATRGLSSALASKDQMIASYLAQESMETIKNRRDNNLAEGLLWSDGMDACGSFGTACDAGAIYGFKSCAISSSVPGCPITFDVNTGYNTDGMGSHTIFFRHSYLEDEGSNNTKQEATVHTIVDWYEGPVPYQVHLMSQIVDTTR